MIRNLRYALDTSPHAGLYRHAPFSRWRFGIGANCAIFSVMNALLLRYLRRTIPSGSSTCTPTAILRAPRRRAAAIAL